MGTSQRWGWDLVRHCAVRWEARGPGDQVLGPYPSREAAEQWQDTVDARNTAWDEADERWHGDDGEPHTSD